MQLVHCVSDPHMSAAVLHTATENSLLAQLPGLFASQLQYVLPSVHPFVHDVSPEPPLKPSPHVM